MNITPVSYKILYNSKNITKDISDHLLSLSYTDKITGESDEIDIELEDKDGLWQNEWYPTAGDTVDAEIEDAGAILRCGKFTVDERKFKCDKSGGDNFSFSGLAAGITKKMRSKKSTAHENKTLRELANTVAGQHGLTIQGTIPDIRFDRITQNRETDLAFLNRMANVYGLLFSVRDSLLVFQSMETLEKKPAVISIDKTEVLNADFTDKTESFFTSVTVQYHNPEKSELISKKKPTTRELAALAGTVGSTVEDSELVQEKAENEQQANAIAEAVQRKILTTITTCSVSVPGNVLLLSGVNVELTGFGKMSGIFHITESKHTLSKGDGYTTGFEAKKVNTVPATKYKSKKKKNPVVAIVTDGNETTSRTGRWVKQGKDEVLVFDK